MPFKKGDMIRMKEDCTGAIKGNTYECISPSSLIGAGCSCPNKWELVSDKPHMKSLNAFFRSLVDKDIQSLYKAEYINGELALTDKGKQALLQILFTIHKGELVKLAEEEIGEAEKAK